MLNKFGIVIIILGFSVSTSAQNVESDSLGTEKKYRAGDLSLLSINATSTSLDYNPFSSFSSEIITFYSLLKKGKNENSVAQGFAISFTLPVNRIDGDGFHSASFGATFGGGYGLHTSNVSLYGTLNTQVFSYNKTNNENSTSFFPENSSFLRLAGIIRPFAKLEKKLERNSIGIHTALDLPLIEGAEPTVTLGISLTGLPQL